MPIKYMVPLFIAFWLGGCAHTAPVRPGGEAAVTAEVSPPTREELLRSVGKEPAAEAVKKDDFIEVDDKKGLSKSWPMALLMGLVAAAAAAI